MTDEPLIAALMAANDTLSRGEAIEAIRIVRAWDQRENNINQSMPERLSFYDKDRKVVDALEDLRVGPRINMKPRDL